MEPILVTAPTIEPVSLSEAKTHCRIDYDDDDTLIEGWISVAREYFEDRTGLTLHETVWELRLTEWLSSPFELPRAAPLWLDPTTGLADVTAYYRDTAGAETAWTAFVLDIPPVSNAWRKVPPAQIALAHGESFPSFTPYPVAPIRIRYKAGLANASPQIFPAASICAAIKELVAGFSENRESEVFIDRRSIDAIAKKYGVETFIAMHKVSYAF